MKYGKVFPQGNVKADCWQLEYDNTLSVAATTVTISGLTGNTAKEYRLIIRFVNDYNGATSYLLRFNGDTGSNYGYQYLAGVDTAASAARGVTTSMELGYCSAQDEICFLDKLIYAKSGYVRTSFQKASRSISSTTVTDIILYSHSWNNSADEITSMNIAADQTDGLGIGTHIELWKKVDR